MVPERLELLRRSSPLVRCIVVSLALLMTVPGPPVWLRRQSNAAARAVAQRADQPPLEFVDGVLRFLEAGAVLLS